MSRSDYLPAAFVMCLLLICAILIIVFSASFWFFGSNTIVSYLTSIISGILIFPLAYTIIAFSSPCEKYPRSACTMSDREMHEFVKEKEVIGQPKAPILKQIGIIILTIIIFKASYYSINTAQDLTGASINDYVMFQAILSLIPALIITAEIWTSKHGVILETEKLYVVDTGLITHVISFDKIDSVKTKAGTIIIELDEEYRSDTIKIRSIEPTECEEIKNEIDKIRTLRGI